jgi:hypothetical protein
MPNSTKATLERMARQALDTRAGIYRVLLIGLDRAVRRRTVHEMKKPSETAKIISTCSGGRRGPVTDAGRMEVASPTERRARRPLVVAGGLGAALLIGLGSAAGGEEPRAPQGDPQAPTLELLMKEMAATPGVLAEFVERKELSLLAAPLETRGRIAFVPPDRLSRVTTEPDPSALLLDGSRLRYRDGAGGDDVDLSVSPVAREFVDNFVVLFNGDLASLERRYRVSFRAEPAEGSWVIGLVPRDAPLSKLIETITLRGDGRSLREMTVMETDGDRTVTTLVRVDPQHRFTEQELDELFESGGAASPAPDNATPHR